jgi:cell division initiation protein
MFNSDDLQPTGETRRIMSADRTPSVTPIDLRQARFGTAVRGYDKTEVQSLLSDAADGYDQAVRENERLRQELARMEASLAQFRELESSLKNTLISAQRVADDIKETASQEASRIVREAEGRAALIVQKAEARREELERDWTNLKAKRRDAEASVEAMIAALRSSLDAIREQERDERVVPHRPLMDVSRAV